MSDDIRNAVAALVSERVAIIACTEDDMNLPIPDQPRFAIDGSCAHRDIDPLNRCRTCAVEMDDAAQEHRAQAWFDSL